MVENKYKRPGNRVIDVYRGKEMEERIRGALEKLCSRSGVQVGEKEVRRFLGHLSESGMSGELVMIVEKYPLNSMQVRGKCGKKIYSYITKTGNQYVKEYKKPRNPRTPAQQSQRLKYKEAVGMWKALPEPEKEIYRQKAMDLPLTGYNLFIRTCLESK